MALPSNDKIIGDLGHTADHNAIVNEITFIKDNYLSASAGILDFLRKDAASATYATIVSPEFSGVPLAPTAASGTNTSQIATTQFVRSEISSLVDSAPSTLDTLNELAAALGDDPNFATTVTQSLSNKLDSGVASATYLTKDSASSIYFPKSASGGLLTEDEASEIYLRQDTASSIYLTFSDANNLYFPRSASGGLLTEEEASSIYLPISASFNPEGYLTSSAAAEIYLNKIDASNIYFTISSSGTLLTKTEAASTYLPISASGDYLSSSTASAIYLKQESANVIYLSKVEASEIYLPISASASLAPIGYLTEASASAIYLTQIDAENIYLSKSGSGVFLTKNEASNIYISMSSSGQFLTETEASSIYLRQDTASVTYLPISASSSFSTVGYLTASAAEILYASLVSPVFSGSPTTPTPPTGTNNNQIATTAFVSDAILAVQTGSAVDLSAYLRSDTASATYLAKNDIIDGGVP